MKRSCVSLARRIGVTLALGALDQQKEIKAFDQRLTGQNAKQ